MKKIFVLTGEPSGDKLASKVIAQLKSSRSDIEYLSVGGEYLKSLGIRSEYMHSEIDALERVKIIRGLRLDQFDVLVGINLLREGLDLPEVSLVAVLDADKQGFLRSESALLQVSGRAARNVSGRVLLFADKISPAMQKLIDVTEDRRKIQNAYNKKHKIKPKTIFKSDDQIKNSTIVAKESEFLDDSDLNIEEKDLDVIELKDLIKTTPFDFVLE